MGSEQRYLADLKIMSTAIQIEDIYDVALIVQQMDNIHFSTADGGT